MKTKQAELRKNMDENNKTEQRGKKGAHERTIRHDYNKKMLSGTLQMGLRKLHKMKQ